jgi:hypothetical protein
MSLASHARLTLLGVASMAAAACSDSSTGPATPNVPDVAGLLAEMSPSSIVAAAGLAGSSSADLARFPSADPGICAFTASSGWFVCPTVTVNGLTFARMFRLIDGSGNAQSKPDANTSAIETKSSVNGTVSQTVSGGVPSSGTYTINGNSDQTLSGIRTNKHTLNGVSTTSIRGTIQVGASTIPIDMTETETTANLVLPNAKAGQQWPQSGTITLDSSTHPGDPAQSLRTVITFNGTSTITMTMTSPFGTITCHFDLANPGASQGACSG